MLMVDMVDMVVIDHWVLLVTTRTESLMLLSDKQRLYFILIMQIIYANLYTCICKYVHM